jgi:hypothetical protein
MGRYHLKKKKCNNKPVCIMAAWVVRPRGVGAVTVGGAGVAVAAAFAVLAEEVAGFGAGCVRAFSTAACKAGPK